MMPSELFVCGPLNEVRRLRRTCELHVGARVFNLHDSDFGELLSRGSYLRMLARPDVHDDRYEIVVLQAEGYDPRYVDHFVSWPVLALAVVLLMIGFGVRSPTFCGLGVFLATLYMWSLRRRLHAFQRFAALSLRAGRPAHAPPALASPASPLEPLAVSTWFQALESVEFAHDALIGWDLQSGAIVYWNSGASCLFGYSQADALTKVRSDLPGTWDSDYDTVLRELRSEHTWVGVVTRPCKDGGELRIHTRLTILLSADHDPVVVEMNWTCRTRGDHGRRRANPALP